MSRLCLAAAARGVARRRAGREGIVGVPDQQVGGAALCTVGSPAACGGRARPSPRTQRRRSLHGEHAAAAQFPSADGPLRLVSHLLWRAVPKRDAEDETRSLHPWQRFWAAVVTPSLVLPASDRVPVSESGDILRVGQVVCVVTLQHTDSRSVDWTITTTGYAERMCYHCRWTMAA